MTAPTRAGRVRIRLIRLSARKLNGQHALGILRINFVRIDRERQLNRTFEMSLRSFAAQIFRPFFKLILPAFALQGEHIAIHGKIQLSRVNSG